MSLFRFIRKVFAYFFFLVVNFNFAVGILSVCCCSYGRAEEVEGGERGAGGCGCFYCISFRLVYHSHGQTIWFTVIYFIYFIYLLGHLENLIQHEQKVLIKL